MMLAKQLRTLLPLLSLNWIHAAAAENDLMLWNVLFGGKQDIKSNPLCRKNPSKSVV